MAASAVWILPVSAVLSLGSMLVLTRESQVGHADRRLVDGDEALICSAINTAELFRPPSSHGCVIYGGSHIVRILLATVSR
jgi:hypothetical protein